MGAALLYFKHDPALKFKPYEAYEFRDYHPNSSLLCSTESYDNRRLLLCCSHVNSSPRIDRVCAQQSRRYSRSRKATNVHLEIRHWQGGVRRKVRAPTLMLIQNANHDQHKHSNPGLSVPRAPRRRTFVRSGLEKDNLENKPPHEQRYTGTRGGRGYKHVHPHGEYTCIPLRRKRTLVNHFRSTMIDSRLQTIESVSEPCQHFRPEWRMWTDVSVSFAEV